MPDLDTDDKTRLQAAERVTGFAAMEPMPTKTLARRRRLLRYGGVFTFLLTIGLSSIPGPKGSSQTLSTITQNGVKTQVFKFYYSRQLGLPFQTGHINYTADGSAIDNVSIQGDGFLGNLGAAFAIVVGASIFFGRRRRDD